MSAFCPSCGYSLGRDEVIETHGFVIDPRGVTRWRDVDCLLTVSEQLLLHSIAAAAGRAVSRHVLCERIGSAGGPEIVSVFIFRIRLKLGAAGAPDPIGVRRGQGYFWIPALTAH